MTELLEVETARVADLSLKAVSQDAPHLLVAQGAYGGLVEVGRD